MKHLTKLLVAALLALGLMYYNGQGVRQNFHLSKEWFGKVCDSGDQSGCDKYHSLNQAGY